MILFLRAQKVKPQYVRLGFASSRLSFGIGRGEACLGRGDDLDPSSASGLVPAGAGGTDGLVLTGCKLFLFYVEMDYKFVG